MTLAVRFIRHGESVANAGGVTAEPAGIPLTALGRDQALAIALGIEAAPDLIITSPYIRARDTAAPTAARFPNVPVEVWPVQEFASLAFARCENTTAMQRRPWVEEHWALADPDRVDGPGAECYAALVGRVRAALRRLSELSISSVVVFSHGQFMKAVHWEIAAASPPITPETMQAFRAFHAAAPIANAEGFTARWDGKGWRVD
jgi:broad specificity phosphatase PhoE